MLFRSEYGFIAHRTWTVHDITLTAPYCSNCAVHWASLETMFEHGFPVRTRERSNQDKIRALERLIPGPDPQCIRYEFASTRESFDFSIFRVPQQDDLAQANTAALSLVHKSIPIRFVLPSSNSINLTLYVESDLRTRNSRLGRHSPSSDKGEHFG